MAYEKTYPLYRPPGKHENPTIQPDRSSPKVHPPKRKEKTKTPAPGNQSSKIKQTNKNTHQSLEKETPGGSKPLSE